MHCKTGSRILEAVSHAQADHTNSLKASISQSATTRRVTDIGEIAEQTLNQRSNKTSLQALIRTIPSLE